MNNRIIRNITVLCLAAGLTSCGRGEVRIDSPSGEITLVPLADNAVRVVVGGQQDAPDLEELIYVGNPRGPKFTKSKDDGGMTFTLPRMSVRYDSGTGLLTFFDAEGQPIVGEVSRTVEASELDGVPCSAVAATFDSPQGEHIYGTGQFQDGYLDVRGLTRRLTQVNTQIAIPFILSNRGYALMWHNYGLTDFNPADQVLDLAAADSGDGSSQTVNATGTSGNRRETRFFSSFTGTLDIPEDGIYCLMLDVGQKMGRRHYLAVDGAPVIDVTNTWLPPTSSVMVKLTAGQHSVAVQGVRGDTPKVFWRMEDGTTTFSSPVANALDYTVFAGGADQCISTYRKLTGEVPQMPSWMFGYIHCRERYSSSDDILTHAAGFKDRGIPLDVIVQDWQWWGKYGWNALRFDEDHYPDPKALTDSLHRDDVHLMLSVWSKVSREAEFGHTLAEKGYYIPDTEWIDFFNPEAATFYSRSFIDSLYRYGIDAWWFDATEPENDDLDGRTVGDGIPGGFYRNVYPLKVNSTMYEALHSCTAPEEPVILTRSAFLGIQRYGVVTWSGDVGNDFEALRRQIAGGLGQMSSGLPWWTFDAGGFFRPGNQYEDEEYQERMIRWIQTSVFLPFMRVHGYMSKTEPWYYSDETYRRFTDCIKQRKALQPYIEECAARVSSEGYTMMRPLVFDFPDDEEALRQDCEFMFGPDYLVCPVLEAGIDSMEVYLPQSQTGWTDIRDGSHYDGGQYLRVSVDLDAIPVFSRK